MRASYVLAIGNGADDPDLVALSCTRCGREVWSGNFHDMTDALVDVQETIAEHECDHARDALVVEVIA